MILLYSSTFNSAIKKFKDKKALMELKNVLIALNSVSTISGFKNSKKLKGHKAAYRIRIGDYRLGFFDMGNNTLEIDVFVHRKDAYKNWP